MRETETSIWMVRSSTRPLLRAIHVSAVALGIGLIMVCGAARAQDDEEEDDKTFEEKIIEGIMGGLGATNMENKGIDYRERSPLVVPPKLNLPPPASAEAKVPNWPKDPDEARRKAAIEARKKEKKKDIVEDSRPLTPSEMNVGRTAARPRTDNDPVQPGVSNNPVLSPAQLGFTGGLSQIFGGNGNKPETADFKGEPTRDSLTQPPPGYQTPSPNFAYGTGPKESLNKVYDPARGKYGD